MKLPVFELGSHETTQVPFFMELNHEGKVPSLKLNVCSLIFSEGGSGAIEVKAVS